MGGKIKASEVLNIAQDWFDAGRKTALVTVLATWGSAPRPAGSHLVCDSQGNFEGSVSGGCIEAEVLVLAADVLASGTSRVVEFGISDETAWGSGLSCGGTLKLIISPVDQAMREILARLNQARMQRQMLTCKTDLSSGILQIETGALPAKDTTLTDTSFIQIYRPSPQILVIGAVHIAQALAKIANISGYDLTIIDPRTGFATRERFPDINLEALWPQDYFSQHPVDTYTAVVALSHIPHIDDGALLAALKSGCFYVGALGSRKNTAKREARLLQQGLSAEQCSMISSPVGLDIGAREPAEIAIAIMAEIIQRYRRIGQ